MGPSTNPSRGDAAAVAAFDSDRLEATSSWGPLKEWILSDPRRLTRIARLASLVLRLLPFIPWSIVVRYEQVREVLSKDEHFPVDWGARMVEVTEGKNFVLGMPRGDEYRRSYSQLAEAFRLEDVHEHVALAAAEISARIIDQKKDSEPYAFDAVQDLITAVPTELCERYFGIGIPDKVLFAKWTLAISSYLFGPTSSEAGKQLALAATHHLRGTIRQSIACARANSEQGIVLRRLIKILGDEDPDAEDVIHAQLFGMVMGFIPTNVLAGGNILETLLRRPDFLERARAAALVDDDTLLWRCLRETLRFRHINPGPWRICPAGYTLGEGGSAPMRIRQGRKVLAIIQAAMFDPRWVERPEVFDPERRDEDYLVFGVGQHWCLGAYIAQAQITHTFKHLLKLKNLMAKDNPAVRTKRFNDLFPLHLEVEFEG